jgi:hypothetical protein
MEPHIEALDCGFKIQRCLGGRRGQKQKAVAGILEALNQNSQHWVLSFGH